MGAALSDLCRLGAVFVIPAGDTLDNGSGCQQDRGRSVRDREDIELLLDRLKITSAATVWDTVARFFPATEIPQRSRLLIEDLMARDRGHDRGRAEGLER